MGDETRLEKIGRYEIETELGRGGMATVYKAYHAALDRYVALKVLHPAFNQDPNCQSRSNESPTTIGICSLRFTI